MRILADTNVIIDALTSREPWNKSAEEIFLMAANHTIEMYITASSATDIYYLIRKHLHNIEAAKMIMGKLYSLTGILEVTADDCMDALASAISDYEDAVVEKVASRKDMDYIVTRNIKDYQAGGTKIILPDDFVKLSFYAPSSALLQSIRKSILSLERETHYSLLPHFGQNSKSSVVVYPQLLHLFVVFPLPFSKP